MRLVLLCAASLLLEGATGTALAAADGPISAGYWESTSKVISPIPSAGKPKRECISGKKINSYLTGPATPHYTCHYDTRHVENGHAELEGECVDSSGFHSKIKVEGQYTATSFNLDGHLKVMLGGLSIPVNANIEAHRLSEDCPAGTAETDDKKKPEGE